LAISTPMNIGVNAARSKKAAAIAEPAIKARPRSRDAIPMSFFLSIFRRPLQG